MYRRESCKSDIEDLSGIMRPVVMYGLALAKTEGRAGRGK